MNENEKEILGERVKQKRKKMKLTQKELSEMLGVSFGTIRTIEIGKARSIGAKVASILHNFLSQNSNTQVAIGDNIQNINSYTHKEYSKMFEILATLIVEKDFDERVLGISKYAKISEKEAVILLFENAIKQNNI